MAIAERVVGVFLKHHKYDKTAAMLVALERLKASGTIFPPEWITPRYLMRRGYKYLQYDLGHKRLPVEEAIAALKLDAPTLDAYFSNLSRYFTFLNNCRRQQEPMVVMPAPEAGRAQKKEDDLEF
jgi:hypothetical protein